MRNRRNYVSTWALTWAGTWALTLLPLGCVPISTVSLEDARVACPMLDEAAFQRFLGLAMEYADGGWTYGDARVAFLSLLFASGLEEEDAACAETVLQYVYSK